MNKICELLDILAPKEGKTYKDQITYVEDRAGHDLRYAIDATKIKYTLGWRPSVTFEEGLDHTVDWYLANSEWIEEITSGSYREYYESMYDNR